MAFSSYRLPSSFTLPFSSELTDDTDSPLGVSGLGSTVNSTTSKKKPSFHLLIPASEPNPDLCKTLLSSFLLDYPPPTLINFGKVFSGEGENGSHAGKIRGVYEYLKDQKQVSDDDLVLITDGYDAWFQLPPEVMIRRYHILIREVNERLQRKYGMITHEPREHGSTATVQKYVQNIVFGADKLCWPNAAEDAACAAVPPSTIATNVYGAGTDQDPEGFQNRPRYLNSGTIIGPVADIRVMYEWAFKKAEAQHRSGLGDQFVFAEIFGEQEFQREAMRRSSQGAGGRWLDWLAESLGNSVSPFSANKTINSLSSTPGQRYEFGIGLDYESRLFQTMTHSTSDIEFLYYNDSRLLSHIQETHRPSNLHPLLLTADIARVKSPMSISGNKSEDFTGGFLFPLSYTLDMLPDKLTWEEVPLATNLFAPSIPPLLHFNGDKSLLSTWWPSMWFYPYSRALLRRYIRSTQGPAAAQAADTGGQDWWDMRGGKGGVWTDKETWMDWGDICNNTEAIIFADGKGTWAKEEGTGEVVNKWGKVIVEKNTGKEEPIEVEAENEEQK